MAKLKTDLPKCRNSVGMICVLGLAWAGLLDEWMKNWPVHKILKKRTHK